jgi:zinc protease
MMREGTTTKDAAAISKAAAAMGGDVDVSVNPDAAILWGEGLSEFASDLVGLVAVVASHPAWPAPSLERLRADKLRQLALAKSNPGQLAAEKFNSVIYGDHPYGRVFPTEAMLKGFTLAQAKAFYGAHWSAAGSRLYIVGRFDPKAVEATVHQAFGGWEKGTASRPAPPHPTSERAVYIVEKPGAVQTTLIVGLPTIDPSNPDATALDVTNNLLGGYFSSRVTSNIRESKGYTYTPYSVIANHYRDATWAQHADVSTAVTGASLKEIFYEIDRLRAEAPGEAELDAVKNYMAGTFVLVNSDRRGIAAQLDFVDEHGLGADYLATWVSKVRAVTPAKVQEMAKKYIDSGRVSIIAVGDRKAIEEQVKPYGPLK